MPIHITEEANRCLNCKVPQCQKACPVHTPIPKVIQMFKQHQVAEAGQMLFDNNPMSAMCSIVCNHEAQCQGHCVLGRKGSPVHFSAIENYVSGTYLDRMKVQKAEPNGKKVAVVGSGPAGLTAAIKLAEAGCDVTIFERSQCIGGVMEYGIPDFRGAGRARKLGTPGETRADVQFGIDYLVHPTSTQVGKTVAVIGAGNVAMDVARTVLRHGAEQVTLYARSNHISANSDEVEYTELDGAEILCGYAIAGINDEGPYFHVAEFDEEGNVTGYSEDVEQRQADTTMICVSQMPKNRLVITTPGLEADDRGRLVVDENLMTTMPGIFAAGDVISGPKTVVHAVDGAKQAVAGMLRYLGVAEEAAVEA